MAINLLPWRERHIIKSNFFKLATLFIMIIAMCLGIFLIKFYLQKHLQLQIQANQRLAEQTNLSDKTTDLNKTENNLQTLQKQVKIINDITSRQLRFWSEYSLLQKIIPLTMVLNKIEWNPHQLTIEGFVREAEQVGLVIIGLSHSQLFALPELKLFTQSEQGSKTHFVIVSYHQLDSV